MEDKQEASWGDVPEYGETPKTEGEQPPKDDQPPEATADTQQTEEPEVVQQESAEENDAIEDDPQKDAKPVPWEKRYKDMEREFGKRGTRIQQLDSEIQLMRLEKVEQQQRLGDLEKRSQNTPVDKPVKALDESEWFNEDEQAVIKEFPDVVGVAKKYAALEGERLKRELSGKLHDDYGSQKSIVEKQEEEIKRLNAYVNDQASNSYLRENVGSNWKIVDGDPSFHSYVNSSDVMKKMMQYGAVDERGAVYKAYLQTPDGVEKYSKKKQSTPASDDYEAARNSRRETAKGLVSNTPPKHENAPIMSSKELWESIPEYGE